MDNAFGVGRIECVGKLNGERQYLFSFQRTARNAVLQRDTVQKLHGDEGLPVLVVNLVDGADVGMVQGRRGRGFALEPGESLRVFRNFVRQELQSNKTV